MPGSCLGSQSQWAFTSSTPPEVALSVNPTSGTVTAGSSTTATVQSNSPEALALSATGAPAGVAVSFNPTSVQPGGSSTMTVSTTAAATVGPATITVKGTSAAASPTAPYALTVNSPGGGGTTLLSQGRPATASSVESSSFPATAAFDGNLTSTRWASVEGAGTQWLRVDLGATATVSRVKLSWEAAYGKSYTVQTSPNGTDDWTTIFTTTTGNGATDDLTGLSGTGRYVRINATARCTAYGYSLYELQVYGSTN